MTYDDLPDGNLIDYHEFDEYEDIDVLFKGFMGTWRGVDQIHKTPFHPRALTADVHATYRMGAAGILVLVDSKSYSGESMIYAYHGVYQQIDGMFEMHSFDGGGPPDVFEGGFINGVLVVDKEDDEGRWRYVQEVLPSGELRSVGMFWYEGRWVEHSTATFSRVN